MSSAVVNKRKEPRIVRPEKFKLAASIDIVAALGAEAISMTPAEFRRFVSDEIVDSAKVIKAQ